MTAPQLTPRPHGWLWEMMSVIGQLLVGIIIAALAAAIAWLFGIITRINERTNNDTSGN